MPEPAQKQISYEDLYAIPENMIGEIIDGELIATPRPSKQHVYAASSLGNEIGPPFHSERGGPGGWIILDEPEIAFDENILVPDLAGWRKERFPESEENNWISVAPDWVCEVLSPGTVRNDKVKKMAIYARHGVQHLWYIDPQAKIFEVFRFESGKWLLIAAHAEDDKVRAEPFQAIAIDLANLWLENRFKKTV